MREAIDRALDHGPVGLVVLENGGLQEVMLGCFPDRPYSYISARPAREEHHSAGSRGSEVGASQGGVSAGTSDVKNERARIIVYTVGRYSVDEQAIVEVQPADRCTGVTHVISVLDVGAFELHSAEQVMEKGRIGFEAIGIGSDQNVEGGSVLGEGNSAVCVATPRRTSEPPEACSVPIRARLVPAKTVAWQH